MITEIRANARISFKQLTQSGDVFYTFEYGETNSEKFEKKKVYETEKEKLWEQVNNEVGKQVNATLQLYK